MKITGSKGFEMELHVWDSIKQTGCSHKVKGNFTSNKLKNLLINFKNKNNKIEVTPSNELMGKLKSKKISKDDVKEVTKKAIHKMKEHVLDGDEIDAGESLKYRINYKE